MTAPTANLKPRKTKTRLSLAAATTADEICSRTGTSRFMLHAILLYVACVLPRHNANSVAWQQALSMECTYRTELKVPPERCTYVGDAGASESKKSIGIVTFHDTQSSRGSGERQARSASNCH